MSILNPEFRISASLPESGAVGFLNSAEDDTASGGAATIGFLPANRTFALNELIFTTGFESGIPGNLLIGSLDSIEPATLPFGNRLYRRGVLRPAADLEHLRTVIVAQINSQKQPDLKQDIVKLAVLERHGKNANTGLGFVHGLGIKNGAIATTNAHDSHNICVAGSSDEDMAAAVNAIISMQGGLVVVKDEKVIASVPFPIAGLLSDLPPDKLSAQLRSLAEAARTIGCTLDEPFQQLSFLALPVIPHLKLTDNGLFDVDIFQHIKWTTGNHLHQNQGEQ